jgi:hypothetical protein
MFLVPQFQEMQRILSKYTDILNQITADDSDFKCCGCRENNMHTTKENA